MIDLQKDFGISPAVGLILMIGITVGIATVSGIVLLDIGDGLTQTSNAGVEAQETPNGVEVSWNQEGSAEEIKVKADGETVGTLQNVNDTIVVGSPSGTTISIISVGEGESEKTPVKTIETETDTSVSGSVEVKETTGNVTTPEKPFIIKVDTTTRANNEFKIQTSYNNSDSYTYNYDVSTNGSVTNSDSELKNVSSELILEYESSGVYTIEFSGQYPQLMFDDHSYKVVSVEQWGSNKWKSTRFMFRGADMVSNASDKPDLSEAKHTSHMFSGSTYNSSNITEWDVSNVEEMRLMFRNNDNFNQDISSWDMSNVQDVKLMFKNADNFNNGGEPLDWGSTTQNITNMEGMFSLTSSFNQDISSWDMSSVTNTKRMFSNTDAFNNGGEPLDWGSTTQNIELMDGMFRNASNFNQDISSWNVEKVRDMSTMFSGASSFNQDISSWTLTDSSFLNMNSMFSGASSFNQDISSWDTTDVYSMNSLFEDATSFDQDISSWCVEDIGSKPSDFDTNAGFDGDTSKQPNWGTTC